MNESLQRLWEGREGGLVGFFCLFYRWENTICSHWQSKDKNLEQLPSSLTSSPTATLPQRPQGHAASWVFLLLQNSVQDSALSRLLK